MTNNSKTLKSSELNFSIIIPNYNGAKFIPNCLNSLYRAIKNCPQSQFEIIFVDNGSVDNSIKLSKKIKIPNIKYLLLDTNYGFAGAVNRGINKAKYKYVVLLNNDLTMEPNWFQLISKSILQNKKPNVVTFFGTVLTKDGTKFESQGLEFFIRGKCKNISNGQKYNSNLFLKSDKLKTEKNVWGASASFVVYQKDIIQNIGLFDDDFFAYEEDVDLALRLNKFNYQTLYVPSAISYHLGGGTSSRMGNFRNRMDAKNWIYIIIKNYSAKEFWSNFFNITEERCRNFSGLVKSTLNMYQLKSIYRLPIDLVKTYGEVIINLPKMFKKRHQIKKLLKDHNN